MKNWKLASARWQLCWAGRALEGSLADVLADTHLPPGGLSGRRRSTSSPSTCPFEFSIYLAAIPRGIRKRSSIGRGELLLRKEDEDGCRGSRRDRFRDARLLFCADDRPQRRYHP